MVEGAEVAGAEVAGAELAGAAVGVEAQDRLVAGAASAAVPPDSLPGGRLRLVWV